MINDLYQEMIIDHSKRPRNFGELGEANRSAEGHNPLCGDHFKVFLKENAGVIEQICFQGDGCAISKSSASLMTESVKGKKLEEAERMLQRFLALLTSDSVNGHELGKLAVFSGVKEFPVRVKCATLAWHTLRAALRDAEEVISTE